ncbi:hypothetical protein [Rhodococcus sovatensis]|uniref:AbiEi antitoxin C-terminal domain-containing protein n=1 Tax=Rhodococcus sovatensis TaxID=1805840 RepID=A0ABZ2PKP5_9NOCA
MTVLIVLALWRRSVLVRPHYGSDQLHELACAVLIDLREGAPRPEFPQFVEQYFRRIGVGIDAGNQLLEYMMKQGWVVLYGWSMGRRILGQHPRVALTQNGWERSVQQLPTIRVEGSSRTVINTGAGNLYSSGRDITVANEGLTASDMEDLAFSVRIDMVGLDPESKDAAARIAEVFEQASQSDEVSSGRIQASLAWLKNRVGEASSQLTARAIWESTAAVMRSKGLI